MGCTYTYLEGAAHLNSLGVVDDDHSEVGGLYEIPKHRPQHLVPAPDRGLAELLLGHLPRQVGTHEHVAWDLEVSRDDV